MVKLTRDIINNNLQNGNLYLRNMNLTDINILREYPNIEFLNLYKGINV